MHSHARLLVYLLIYLAVVLVDNKKSMSRSSSALWLSARSATSTAVAME